MTEHGYDKDALGKRLRRIEQAAAAKSEELLAAVQRFARVT